ncbi:aldo/keto reductase [Fadolivirus algeromassiliense]|jgi:diketogulonate reductase-like aldo/keto reductase|uniref:Aldo/keto reductase n=1 Tax=Fadolivirus FV1/VV64 TaxID=3070911 RepID=A0A7D3UTS7_9VIRU|nr:aldo/keto reductase [Fadolivirus algeromassiliense]QKF94530.1 aldo/keto reductase [Fadolivirus FV1/VV64]
METIPPCGFGTYRLRGDAARESTACALNEGYNHIDTANLYGNEDKVGEAIKNSKIPRDKLWITTKIQIKDIKKGKDAMYASISNSLTQLQTSYLDLVLLHGPVEECLIESWSILEEVILGSVEHLKDRVRFIGISNYDVHHLEQLLPVCRIKPYANQFEVSPYLNRFNLIDYCKEKNIIVVAHTSLVKGEKFNDQKLIEMSEQTRISKSLVLLGWGLSHGMVVLPRSSNPEHIKENLQCLQIKLDTNIMSQLNEFYKYEKEEPGYYTHPQYIKKKN